MALWLRFVGLSLLLVSSAVGHDSRPRGPAEDGTRPALARIAGEGFMNSQAFEILIDLSDNVGGRVTGSPESQRSIDWALAKMTSIGLANVHPEKYTMWKGWTRGSASAELLAPVRRKLQVDAMGWTGSTAPNGVDADVVTANLFDLDEEIKHVDRCRGKIVMMKPEGAPRKSFWLIFAQYGDFLNALHNAGAVAVIGGQGGFKAEGLHLTHTGILGFAQDYAIPVVDMTREDQGQLERFLAAGKTPRLHINVQNSLTSGPVETANVVGEIVGREHPEQVVVVGAHLDSWDLSQGTTDDGTGTSSVLAAADAILKSGQHPRRTIRFVLFTGEEQGLLGSIAYTKRHASEINNHLAAIVLDEGQGPINEFQMGGRNDLLPSMDAFADSLVNVRDEIKVTDKCEFGTDVGPFILAGLPGINLNQDSPDYKYTHHSAADAVEAVKADILTQNSTIMALTAFWIADRPDRLASPWTPERTARMLRDKGEYDFLKAFGLWPFGDLGTDSNRSVN